MLYPPSTIMIFPGSITAPWPYMPVPDGCCAGTDHCQSPEPPKPVPRLSTASCGSAAWLISPTQPPYTIIFDPSSVKTAVCPDLLSILVTVLLMANSVFAFEDEDGESIVTKLQLSSGRLQIATWLMFINAVCVWPPNSTKVCCCVMMPEAFEYVGTNPVIVKPASAIGGPLLEVRSRV
jgi:hypothetical protein